MPSVPSASCLVPSAWCLVPSAECRVPSVARPDTGVLVLTEHFSACDDRFVCVSFDPKSGCGGSTQRGPLARLVPGARPGLHSAKAGYG